jgi:hypothetical protein
MQRWFLACTSPYHQGIQEVIESECFRFVPHCIAFGVGEAVGHKRRISAIRTTKFVQFRIVGHGGSHGGRVAKISVGFHGWGYGCIRRAVVVGVVVVPLCARWSVYFIFKAKQNSGFRYKKALCAYELPKDTSSVLDRNLED